MSTPNNPPAFKPTPTDNTNKTVRGKATTTDSSGKAYKEATNILDRDKNKYNVKRFMYPDDLDSNPEYGLQTAVFFINVHSAGKSIVGSEQTLYTIPDEDVNKFAGQRLVSATSEGIAPIAAVVSSEQLDKVVSASKMKRLDAAISLHMPNSIRTNYGVNWGETTDEEMRTKDFFVQSGIKASNGIANSIMGKDKGIGDATGDIAFTGVTNAIVSNLGNYWQKSAQITGGNSKAEQVFQGVEFREFQFAYNFFPKSAAEAENILNIIRLFRYHMLPEFLDQMSFMYIYPSEFNIKYYSNGSENTYLEKLSTCVLKSLEVDYTPSGQFSTFKPTEAGAMPTQINLNMTFQELSKPSKETSPWEGQGL